MGHLTLIAEEVCKFGNRHPPESLDQVVIDRVNREEWITYVEGTLAETRDKDNAVLGGVRPQDSIGVRGMGIGGGLGGGLGGGFTSNTANTLASAGIGAGIASQDSLAMSEGTVGQSFEINSGTMMNRLVNFPLEMRRWIIGDSGTSSRPCHASSLHLIAALFHLLAQRTI